MSLDQQIFLSAVTKEFGDYREKLRHSLAGPGRVIHIQEDFIATGTPLFDKLDRYIRDDCDLMVHFAGDMTGALSDETTQQGISSRYPKFTNKLPELRASFETGEPKLSYTQWEAYLALYHGKRLMIATPADGVPRLATYIRDPAQQESQRLHLARLKRCGYYPEVNFDNAADLATKVANALSILARGVPKQLQINRLNEVQVNRLLVLLDREQAVEDIVDENKGGLQVIYGTAECLADDLSQRLKEFELPWLSRAEGRMNLSNLSLSEWRTHVVCGGEPAGWVLHPMQWPIGENASRMEGVSDAVNRAHKRFLDLLRTKVLYGGEVLQRVPRAESESSTSWLNQLDKQPERYLVWASLDEQCAHANESAELIRLLARTFAGAASDRVRVIIYLRVAPRRPWLGWFAQPSIVEKLSTEGSIALIALGEVARDHLLEWAALSENVVSIDMNMAMAEVDKIYEAAADHRSPIGVRRFSRALRALPMKTVREGLKEQVQRWPARIDR
jgi:hypothetical protein